MSKEQSLSRKLRRGNAFLTFNQTTKQVEVVEKKGTPNYAYQKRKEWSEFLTDKFLKEVTKPLTRMQVRESKQKQVFC